MASTEQPLKKRKLLEAVSETQGLQKKLVVVVVGTLSQEEISAKRRNRDEIRSLYECYKRLRFCVSRKDGRRMPDLEKTYLSLITASRGCTSAQRTIAELIPRYSRYCPTALEAATKVIINMYKWSLPVVIRGEDSDNVALETAKACIIGLVDICCTASSEAPTSSVIRGICSAVFLNVFTFFLHSFEGKDIYQIGEDDIVKVRDSSEFLSELKQKITYEGESTLLHMFKFRALSFLRIFFCCPKNLLAACFDHIDSSEVTDVGSHKVGKYFLRQVTNQIDVTNSLGKAIDEVSPPCRGSPEKNTRSEVETFVSVGNQNEDDKSLVSKNCLIGVVLLKNPSLREWILSKYNKLRRSTMSEAVSEASSTLEAILEVFPEVINEPNCQKESNEDNSDPSKFISQQNVVDPLLKSFTSDIQSVNDSNHEQEGLRSAEGRQVGDLLDSFSGTPSTRKSFMSNTLFSPINRRQLDTAENPYEGGQHLIQVEMDPATNADLGFPSSRSISRGVSNASAIHGQHSAVQYHASVSQVGWYFDGDPASMDVFSASKQLWLGSLGPDATESLVRFQFEKFGPIDSFLFFPGKGFALIEYRDTMDAIKARKYMRGSSPWGSCLRIKFLDIGLGSRGSVNGVAVGANSHVYIGMVTSQLDKDEILRDLMRVGFRAPQKITDLSSESALLMEFETAEDASIVMAHLRQYRKESGYHVLDKSLRSQADGARFFSTPTQADFRSNNQETMLESPHFRPPVSQSIGSPRIELENRGGHENRLSANFSQAEGHTTSHVTENVWMYSRPDYELQFSASASMQYPPMVTQGPTNMPVHHIRASSFTRPVYLAPNNAWDAHSLNHRIPLNTVSPGIMPNHVNLGASPFLPASVTPLTQLPGGPSSTQHFNQMTALSAVPHLPPPPPDMLPPSPPPLPMSRPPLVPPPPTSPPSPHLSAIVGSSISQYQWQGTICKSGVHYCTVYAHKEDSDSCKYSNSTPELAEWPAELDVTKRTDIQHVKSTFMSCPPHKREVCRMVPSTAGDHKGFQDFISYLKQRECAGVIKIPAVSSMWSRLLFILPYSQEMCSMLGIAPHPSECLIALILPKETNSEWV